ncbi:hypothetical protein GDO81_007156 [Engystomops pustulosus]|uniref:Uncharacterized protein n=1 Tax=Engystomops pustulosus TaxID=76066 RepID=A0AAV7C5A9_ENGPU|nr:hypothetical protein GDO81_007156 [Engystomops pustulosus]
MHLMLDHNNRSPNHVLAIILLPVCRSFTRLQYMLTQLCIFSANPGGRGAALQRGPLHHTSAVYPSFSVLVGRAYQAKSPNLFSLVLYMAIAAMSI